MLFSKSHEDDDEDQGAERWLVSYADFITLLFAFFVVLYATSQEDREKAKEFQDSIRKTMSKLGIGGTTVKVETTVSSPIQNQLNRPGKVNTVGQKTQKFIERYIEENFSSAEIEKIFSELTDDIMGVKISVATRNLFVSNSLELSDEGKNIIIKLSAAFKKTGLKLWIEGHTKARSNLSSSGHWKLGALLTSTVVGYIVSETDFSEDQIVSVSYADRKPIFTGVNRYKNQRIDFIVLTELSPI